MADDAEASDRTCSRRAFLAGAAGAAALTSTGGFSAPATADMADTVESIREQPADGEPPYGEGRISPESHRLLAEHEYYQQKKGNTISYDKKLDAVENLGCDPTGNEPIQGKIMDAAADGVLIVFPPGVYLVTGEITINVSGTFGLVGKGFQQSTKPPKPGKGSTVLKVETSSPVEVINTSPLATGQIGNFVLDRRNSPQAGLKVRSGGNVRLRDVRVIGAQTFIGGEGEVITGTLAPMAPGGGSLLVVERFITRGGGIPGTKNIGACPTVGVFGRGGDRGTIFLKDCVAENGPNNGIYGSRTDADVYVHGGLYRNNDVNQVRVNGDARIDGVDVVIDEKNYTGLKSKSIARERGPGWPAANGIKIETEPKIGTSTGTPIKNCNLVAASVADASRVGALVYVWGSGGAVTVENSRITTNISETVSVFAEAPGSGDDPPAPKPWRFMMKNSVVQGKGAGEGGPAVSIHGRLRSLVSGTCFQYPGASKDDIDGAGVSNCGFGTQCKSAGLRAPKKVGSGGDLATIPVNVRYSGSPGGAGNPARARQRAHWLAGLAQAIVALIVVVLVLLAAVVMLPLLALYKLIVD